MMVHNSGKDEGKVSRLKLLLCLSLVLIKMGLKFWQRLEGRACDKRRRIVLFQIWHQARDRKTEGLSWSA